MKLIRTIVDEIPSTCRECIFCIDENRYGDRFSNMLCSIQDMGIDNIDGPRPKWCPLVTVKKAKELLDMKYHIGNEKWINLDYLIKENKE